MTPKEYLAQGIHLDIIIKNKIDQIADIEALLTRVSATLSDVKVQTSVDDHKNEDLIIKMLEQREELFDDFDRYARVRKEIKEVINAVDDNDLKLLLEMRYITYMKWEEIADKLGYSIQHVYRLRKKALARVEKIIQNKNMRVNVIKC